MKKLYTILAIAAVAAVGCSKTEVGSDSLLSNEKINFEVASFMDQTKAAGDAATTLNAEGFTTFYTYANLFPEIGDTQVYMNNVAVNYSDSPKQWAPARDYYWPKAAGSYINFYSYVNTASQDPAITFNSEKTVATAKYTDKTIAATDNILLADAALKQNGNLSTYTSISGVSGVPTLFRHLLAKVAFKVQLVTTNEKKSANTRFVVTILNTGETLSNVKANNKGSYTVYNKFNDTKGTLAWSANNDGTDDAPAVWSPASGVETISFLTPALTLAKNTVSSGEPVDLLAERSVMPQTLDGDNDFTLSYKVDTYYDEEASPYMSETFKVTDKLATLVSTIAAWNKNTKITYTIKIDPVGNKVTFDPAVEEWGTENGTLELPRP